ncbi:MAG: type II toxin-antitoxin system HicA family toxin [Firmicutes bacterium]|jgi:predicted RNA binding protein YcfA (HicA-like mRNA interferase family)|nr:type II toxin-antitoxin system HicA family toxin [Bacillota bacterium]MCL5065530.1 type II toxin-antitoxin system HicA family toxin [Bacillota bacterium]
MKTPRDWSGQDLARRLERLGYVITRQTGSHVRCTTKRLGEHHLTIPNHADLKVGTLHYILAEVGRHFDMTTDDVLEILKP